MGKYLFVYGSLRRVFNHPMHRLLAAESRCIGEATWQGKLFSLYAYPGAVTSGNPADNVRGEVYELFAPEHLLPVLDAYEDFLPGQESRSLYLRQGHPVQMLADSRVVTAWVYVYNQTTQGLSRVASGDWADGFRG
ncbi:MAG: gamma-glutamylcyclotransferase [Cytophagaceae bacterium]|nr:gamma-glutamylcyclotransferase [Cytophagaceae bacterium]